MKKNGWSIQMVSAKFHAKSRNWAPNTSGHTETGWGDWNTFLSAKHAKNQNRNLNCCLKTSQKKEEKKNFIGDAKNIPAYNTTRNIRFQSIKSMILCETVFVGTIAQRIGQHKNRETIVSLFQPSSTLKSFFSCSSRPNAWPPPDIRSSQQLNRAASYLCNRSVSVVESEVWVFNRFSNWAESFQLKHAISFQPKALGGWFLLKRRWTVMPNCWRMRAVRPRSLWKDSAIHTTNPLSKRASRLTFALLALQWHFSCLQNSTAVKIFECLALCQVQRTRITQILTLTWSSIFPATPSYGVRFGSLFQPLGRSTSRLTTVKPDPFRSNSGQPRTVVKLHGNWTWGAFCQWSASLERCNFATWKNRNNRNTAAVFSHASLHSQLSEGPCASQHKLCSKPTITAAALRRCDDACQWKLAVRLNGNSAGQREHTSGPATFGRFYHEIWWIFTVWGLAFT